ncbi:MAG: hypothetical protein JWL76_598 [Thermoleophilia bacterium]|nr:hypothetical protein [Thermoleophilia bacterium]
MRRPALPLLVLIVACMMLAPAGALAHELLVAPVGSAEIDAGLADPARLVHATLDQPGDTLVVTVTSTGTPLELLLLVPDRTPERAFRGDDLPRIDLAPANTPGEAQSSGGTEAVDEATAVDYRVIDAATIAPRDGTKLTITVRRGDQPARVALRVGAPTSFEAADFERTPRTIVQLRGWAETPAPSAKLDRTPAKTASRPVVAIFGAGVALLGVLIAVWWVYSGRRRSRERGVERAAEERGS